MHVVVMTRAMNEQWNPNDWTEIQCDGFHHKSRIPLSWSCQDLTLSWQHSNQWVKDQTDQILAMFNYVRVAVSLWPLHKAKRSKDLLIIYKSNRKDSKREIYNNTNNTRQLYTYMITEVKSCERERKDLAIRQIDNIIYTFSVCKRIANMQSDDQGTKSPRAQCIHSRHPIICLSAQRKIMMYSESEGGYQLGWRGDGYYWQVRASQNFGQ